MLSACSLTPVWKMDTDSWIQTSKLYANFMHLHPASNTHTLQLYNILCNLTQILHSGLYLLMLNMTITTCYCWVLNLSLFYLVVIFLLEIYCRIHEQTKNYIVQGRLWAVYGNKVLETWTINKGLLLITKMGVWNTDYVRLFDSKIFVQMSSQSYIHSQKLMFA